MAYSPAMRWTRRTARQPRLFPGYMFVELRSGTDDLLRIRSLPGVSYVLPRGLPPVVLPDTFIAQLRQRELLGTRRLQPGDRVIVLAEPFRSIEAVFDRRLNSVGRVRVLLQLVHRGAWLNVDETSLLRRDEASSPRATARRAAHGEWSGSGAEGEKARVKPGPDVVVLATRLELNGR